MEKTLNVTDVVFREDLYPRIKHDPAIVQRYAENLDVLPPIEVNQRNELIDGFHRWVRGNEIQHVEPKGNAVHVRDGETVPGTGRI